MICKKKKICIIALLCSLIVLVTGIFLYQKILYNRTHIKLPGDYYIYDRDVYKKNSKKPILICVKKLAIGDDYALFETWDKEKCDGSLHTIYWNWVLDCNNGKLYGPFKRENFESELNKLGFQSYHLETFYFKDKKVLL